MYYAVESRTRIITTAPSLHKILADVRQAHVDNAPNKFEIVFSVYGTHNLFYNVDEDGIPYVLFGFNLPPYHFTAEIDDNTFGNLQGFRIELPSTYNDTIER